MTIKYNTDAPGNPEREEVVQKLQTIKGISSEIAEALYDIGIHSYSELIQYMNEHSLEELSEALKNRGVERSPGFIKKYDWPGQAAQLKLPEETSPQQTEDKSIQTNTSTKKQYADHDAIFYVYFDMMAEKEGEQVLQTTVHHKLQTTVYDEKNGGEEEQFEGYETTPWVEWMLERANLPIVSESVANEAQAGEISMMVAPYDVQLEISNVEVSVVGPSSDVPEKRLKAEVSFRLFGDEATTVTMESIPFRIEIHTIEMESKSSDLIASERGKLKSETYMYNEQLKFPIPKELGSYELHTIVLLLPPGEKMASYVGPTVNVKP